MSETTVYVALAGAALVILVCLTFFFVVTLTALRCCRRRRTRIRIDGKQVHRELAALKAKDPLRWESRFETRPEPKEGE